MTSSIGWLDQSEEQQRRMREVIALFQESGTVDDIGIGVVRDAFSDLLFPGLSTVQTRARYFLLVPWVYQRLADEHVPASHAADKARRWELDLISALKQGGTTAGVIGVEAGESLKQLPSFIYWNGLRTLGIRTYTGTRGDYHRTMNRLNHQHRAGVDDPGDNAIAQRWHHNLPTRPDDLFEGASLDLTELEAKYLQERFVTANPESLFAHLARNPAVIEDMPMPWDAVDNVDLGEKTAIRLAMARYFSEVIHGAGLLYNLMLAEKAAERNLAYGDERRQSYLERLADWQGMVEARRAAHDTIERTDFWATVNSAGANVTRPARRFVDRWLDLARDRVDVSSSSEARQLIEHREGSLKKGLSRLRNPRALENWGGASGAGQPTYRWAEGSSAITDVARGLGIEKHA